MTLRSFALAQWLAHLLPDEKIVDVAEESGQWLENVDRTHLVLASGKLVLLQKTKYVASVRPDQNYKFN